VDYPQRLEAVSGRAQGYRMKARFLKMNLSATIGLIGLGLLTVLPLCRATDSYDYQPGETLVIDHGLSPDKRFSIAAGASDKGRVYRFCLFLVDAKSRKRIGPLEELQEPLDTGAQSFHAAWTPDSRHVAITYRVDRHEFHLLIYRIEGRRAFSVTGPLDLFDAVKGAKAVDASKRLAIFLEPKWLNAKQFVLHQESQYGRVSPDPAPLLGAYAQVEEEESEGAKGGDGKKYYTVDFHADGICELVEGDKYRLLSVKPAAH
jgi:hypothetical protein